MKKSKMPVFIGLFCIVVAGLAYYLYTLIDEAGDMWPSLNKPGSLTQINTQLEREVQNLRLEVAKIPEAEEQLAQIMVDFDLATRVLPRESSPDQLIAAIRTKAQQAGVAPSNLQPSIAKGRGPFEVWRFALNLQGSYDQIANFVNRMEEFDSADASQTGSEKRFFELISINMSSQQNGLANLGPGSGRNPILHSCTLTMQTYRYLGD